MSETISGEMMLFAVIKNMLKDTKYYNCYFGIEDTMKPNICNIDISSPTVSKYRPLNSGQRLNRISYITLNFNGQAIAGSITDMTATIENLIETINSSELADKKFYVKIVNESQTDVLETPTDEYDEFTFVSGENLSGAVKLKRTDQKIPRYSVSFKIYYKV